MVLFLKNKEFTCVHTPHDCKKIYIPLEFNLPQNEISSFLEIGVRTTPVGDGCGGGVKNGAANYNNPTTTTTLLV